MPTCWVNYPKIITSPPFTELSLIPNVPPNEKNTICINNSIYF